MNGILEILLEALEDADRKTLNEIALDEFEKDYSKVKMKNDDIRAELIELANKKYSDTGDNLDTEEKTDEEADEEAAAEAKAALAAKVREEAIAKAAEKRKVRKLKHRKTGRIMTWTPALAKLGDLEEVE